MKAADKFFSEPSPEASPPPDPAILVAEQMLRRVLKAWTDTAIPIGSPCSLTTVRTPSEDWTSLTRDAWASLVFEGQEGADADTESYRHVTWTWFNRVSDDYAKTARRNDDPDERVGKALSKGLAIVGFSVEPEELLPRDLVTAADHNVVVDGPTGDDIAVAVRILTKSEPTIVWGDDEAAAVTPRLLRLACRLEQSADDYFRKLSALVAAEKSAREKPPERPMSGSVRKAPTLDRLHGMDEAVAWGFALRDNLIAFAEGHIAWTDVDTQGCLLSGPPGCGKTLFARAVAATCNVPLISGSYGEWIATGTGGQGEFLRSMRKAFIDAKAKAPSILFIDEVDSFPNRATLRHAWADWEIQVVNALLTEIDGTAGREGVVLIAACNHPHMLDPALIRSGRIERHIRITLPDQSGLERILREHLGDDLHGVSLAQAALLAAGAIGADCERIVRGARGRARQAKRVMLMSDLIAEVGGQDERSPQQMRLAAVHEAGHTLAVCETFPAALSGVSLRGTADTLGTTVTDFPDTPRVPNDVHRRLMCALGGRAAEEVVFGVASSGAGGMSNSDLAHATAMAAMAIASYGFDDVKGLLWSGVPDPVSLPKMLAEDPVLAERVRISMADAYRDAIALMGRRRPALDALTSALLERSALDGPEAERIVAASLT